MTDPLKPTDPAGGAPCAPDAPADKPAATEQDPGPKRTQWDHAKRGEDRRKKADRREDIRFEPGKEDRRDGFDQRHRGGWNDAPTE